ncbi:RYamide receptor-like [Stylophora pistillata]|uniref:RYamide receptor-like n=1 Tax=Stylophora pistillata TaxID=50429 RepID=UPI000C046CC7|nr:RYamide receptor-like [Stylophora pistillata]
MTLNETEVGILTVLYAIAMLVAFAGNGFLIYIVWKKPEVRSLTSFMFVNMAIADLLVTLVVMPWSITQLCADGLWMIPGIFGKITCKFIVYTGFVTITASILCLTFMSVDRYYAIVHPFRRHLWFRKPKLTVPFIWILSLASMSIFPVVQTVEDHNSECMLSVYVLGDPYRALRGIYLFLVVVNYLIPLSVISVIYTITARRLWFHVAPGVEHLAGIREQLETSKRRVVKMLIIVTCAFALCWLPAQVVHMKYVMQKWNIHITPQPIVEFVCFWFGHANSAINPWLYIFLSTKINTAFTRIFRRKSSRSPLSLCVKPSNTVLPEDQAAHEESTL